MFVLFKCPHPQAGNDDGGGLVAAGLRLQVSTTDGRADNSVPDAWVWSGTLAPRSGADIDLSYQVASLKGVTYRIGTRNGDTIKHLRVAFHRQDLDSLRFESGDGAMRSADDTLVWDRRDFLAPDFFSAGITEGRNLYASLTQLLEIGPLVCLLFLLAVTAGIPARRKLTAMQMFTIAAGYALYFPLMLYLSAHLSFVLALIIAAAVPGVLLLNYARWVVGGLMGAFGALAALLLYWVFPTLASFAGWNRGMVLLCLGVVTLWVLINLQNRALRRNATVAPLLAALCLPGLPGESMAADIQVVLPGEIAGRFLETQRGASSVPAVVSFEPVQYSVLEETNDFLVEARVAFNCLRAGESTQPLFSEPVYLRDARVDSLETNLAGIVPITNRLALFVQHAGTGALWLAYRTPIERREGKERAQIPLLTGLPGNARLESPRSDLEILTGGLWDKTAEGTNTFYNLGTTGEGALVVEWNNHQNRAPRAVATPSAAAETATAAKPVRDQREFYGITLNHVRNLTVVSSDGSCTHFAEFEMPANSDEQFQMRLPPKARLISASVDGNEINSPTMEDQLCRVRLPPRDGRSSTRRLSFRIAYPPLRLGFIGTAEFTLPEFFQTAGTIEWVVALPNGFQTQVLSSGLETQSAPPDLAPFGEYGRILQQHPHTYLAKDLVPPGVVGLSLKYRQLVPGIYAP
jgi:hypothetical protein